MESYILYVRVTKIAKNILVSIPEWMEKSMTWKYSMTYLVTKSEMKKSTIFNTNSQDNL